MYVADMNSNCIKVINVETGSFIRKYDKADGRNFRMPSGICLSPDGSKVIISDSHNHRVVVMKRATTEEPGTSTLIQSFGVESYPGGVCMKDDDTIFVANSGNHTINVLKLSNPNPSLNQNPNSVPNQPVVLNPNQSGGRIGGAHRKRTRRTLRKRR